jgi:hypothetical protein
MTSALLMTIVAGWLTGGSRPLLDPPGCSPAEVAAIASAPVEARWLYTQELARAGIGEVQARAIARVACGLAETIAFRPVNPSAERWIRAGAPTKDMLVKPKSSKLEWIEGLIPIDQRLGKASDPAVYDAHVDKALAGRDVTGAHNVTQTYVTVGTGAATRHVCSPKSDPTALLTVALTAAQRKLLDRELADRRALAHEPALRDFAIAHRDGRSCNIVTVLALESPGGPPRPITADYDLLFSLSKDAVARGTPTTSPRFGAVDERDVKVIACLNHAIKDGLHAATPTTVFAFDLVHHGPDVANPHATDMTTRPADYFPAVVFPGCRPPVAVPDRAALQYALLDAARDGYAIPAALRDKPEYALTLESPLAEHVRTGAELELRRDDKRPCVKATVTGVTHARQTVQVRWSDDKRAGTVGFAAVEKGCDGAADTPKFAPGTSLLLPQSLDGATGKWTCGPAVIDAAYVFSGDTWYRYHFLSDPYKLEASHRHLVDIDIPTCAKK